MLPLTEYFTIDLILSYEPSKERASKRVYQALILRLMTAQAKRERVHTGLEALGRATHKTLSAVIAAAKPRLPEGVAVASLSVSYYSQPYPTGKPVMTVDCMNGKIELF